MTLLKRMLINLMVLEGLPASDAASKELRLKVLKCNDKFPDSEVENVLIMYVGGVAMLRDKNAYAEYREFEGTDREFLIKLTEAEED